MPSSLPCPDNGSIAAIMANIYFTRFASPAALEKSSPSPPTSAARRSPRPWSTSMREICRRAQMGWMSQAPIWIGLGITQRYGKTPKTLPLERQVNIFGGLRWRFEEHVPWQKRRLDRVALFQAVRGLKFQPDFTFKLPKFNTISFPWHHNLTAAVGSFWAAKSLRRNPDSRNAISSFQWSGSEQFKWHSQHLMDLGFMEPGQWF